MNSDTRLRIWQSLALGALTVLLIYVGPTLLSRSNAEAHTVQTARGTVAKTVVLSGIVWPTMRASVSPNSPGRVVEVSVRRGETVQAGQLLLKLDPTNAETEVSRRLLALKRAQIRRADAADGGGASPGVADLEVEQAQLDLEVARRGLADAAVRSPITGVVVFLGAKVGDYLAPTSSSSAPIVVANPSDYVVEVEGDEFETSRISVGQEAAVRVMSSDGPYVRGIVTEPPVLKRFGSGPSSAGVFGFTVRIETGGRAPAFGASARVEVTTDRRDDVVVVPLAALRREQGQDFVLVRSHGKTTRRNVAIGMVDMHVAELLDTPEDLDVIVTPDPGH